MSCPVMSMSILDLRFWIARQAFAQPVAISVSGNFSRRPAEGDS
ncbi:hypothetical protein [Thermoleptolyngbya sp.]